MISSLVLLVIFAALIVWQWDTLIEKIAGEKIEEERQGWMERTQELEAMILELQQGKEFKPLLPAERLSQVFGPTSPLVKGASPRSMKCEELEDSLRAFCRYLDAGETFRSQKTHRDSWALFTSILESLERRPPEMSAESYRPSVIVENSFYFFRLLGKEKIDIVREVIKFESDLAEPLMGIMYYWLMTGRSCDKLPSPSAALKIIYNYAGFFLDSLGGHSYLYRQDSRIIDSSSCVRSIQLWRSSSIFSPAIFSIKVSHCQTKSPTKMAKSTRVEIKRNGVLFFMGKALYKFQI